MKTMRKALAWMLTLCLLAALCSAALAETVYVWVGVLPGDSQNGQQTDTAATITGVTVKLNGRTLMDGMCADGSEAVTFSVTDSVQPNTYAYWFSTDGENFTPFTVGGTLGGLLPASTGALYTVYFKVAGNNDAAHNVTVASYRIYYANITSATISNLTVKFARTPLADGTWHNGSEAVTFAVTDSVTPNTYAYQFSADGVTFRDFAEGGTLTLANSSLFQTVYFRAIGEDNPATNRKTVSCTLYYDNDAPTLVCRVVSDKTVRFFTSDAYSGFAGDGSVKDVSFDGGKTWTAALTLYSQGVYSYLAQYSRYGTIAAGTLAVRDRARNVAYWGSEIVLQGQSGGNTSGGHTGGFGGHASSGQSATTANIMYSYAESTYTTVTPYDGMDRIVNEGEMTELAVGDQTLDLALYQTESTENNDTPADFTAAFTTWGGDGGTATDAVDTADDTLVLTAADPGTVGRWVFNGSVYKKLAASGIDYLVLEVGDRITALSTAGFTAGLRYNLFRAAGLASAAFDYTVLMDAGDTRVQMAVEGADYTLSANHAGELYYYDLYTGTRDMMGRPFGQGSDAAADDRQG